MWRASCKAERVMVALARREPEPPRIVLDAQVGTRVRLRMWEASAPVSAKPNAHGDVELAWIDDGAVGYGVGRTRFEVERGRAMVVPEGVEHATTFLSSMRGAALHVDASLVAEIADAIGARGPAIGLVPDATRVAALGAMLSVEATRRDRGALLASDALVEAMLVTALRGAANDEGSSPSDPGIARAVRFAEERYADAISIDDLA
ncbi:MAG TPA: AraC family ligand binding domain-containing protein, partial [Labilithrix sp.]